MTEIMTGVVNSTLGIPTICRPPPPASQPSLDFKGKGYGWICPKCGKVYSPFIEECRDCNKTNKRS